MALTKPEARSLPRLLGREKRLERSLENILRHASSGIADCNPHVWSRDEHTMLPTVVIIEEVVFSRDRQLAAFRHGAAGVHRKIKNCGLQLDCIRFRLP